MPRLASGEDCRKSRRAKGFDPDAEERDWGRFWFFRSLQAAASNADKMNVLRFISSFFRRASIRNKHGRFGLSPERVLRGHFSSVNTASFSPDGGLAFSGGGDPEHSEARFLPGELMVWDAQTWETKTAFYSAGSINSVAFSPERMSLAAGIGVGSDPVHPGVIPGTIKCWDYPSEAERAILRGHQALVNSVSFAPGGRILASASSDGTVKIWDTDTFQELATLRGGGGQSVVFSADGRSLASAGGARCGTVKLWDTSTWRERASLEGYTEVVRAVAFSPDGKTLASGGADGQIRLWDVETGQLKATFDDQGGVFCLAFSPDGRMLASGGAPVVLWDVHSRNNLASMGMWPRIPTLAFSPDGAELIMGSAPRDWRGVVMIWKVAKVLG
jgi:WD40 repeat protein